MVMTFYYNGESDKVVIKQYTRFLKEFPDNTHILLESGDWLLYHNYYRKAAWNFEELVKRIPDNGEFWAGLGMACAYGRLPERAIYACSQAIELLGHGSHFCIAYMCRAWAYRQMKQWDASMADYIKAIEYYLNPYKDKSKLELWNIFL